MTTLETPVASAHAAAPEVRLIHEADVNWALAQGWKDFKAKRGDVIVLALIYPVVGLLAAAMAFNARLLPMIFPLVAGLSIMGPAVASGFYELARRREARQPSGWVHFLDPLGGRNRMGLAALTAGLVVIFAAWLAAAWMIYAVTLSGYQPASLGEFVTRVFSTPEGWSLIVVGMLVGFAFACLTLTVTLASFPMMVDKATDPVTAISTSIRAVIKNPKVSASWGLRVAALLALGCLPLFIGLAVVLPVLGYASWHLYTRLVVR
ncbi:MAG TPA: DUF2189 domain-containing protein [Caulobacteraceae bacterium]|nr:DUF2189 domain-containing protein [Caulobacteraceae bacterium]